MEPGSLVTHVPMVMAAVSHHAVQALVGAGREQPQTEGSPAEPRPLDVGIVSVRLVTGLVRRLSVLVGMRRVGTGRPVIVGRARHRIVRGLVVARIVRGPVVAQTVRGRRPQVTSIARLIARGWNVRATP